MKRKDDGAEGPLDIRETTPGWFQIAELGGKPCRGKTAVAAIKRNSLDHRRLRLITYDGKKKVVELRATGFGPIRKLKRARKGTRVPLAGEVWTQRSTGELVTIVRVDPATSTHDVRVWIKSRRSTLATDYWLWEIVVGYAPPSTRGFPQHSCGTNHRAIAFGRRN
jgi:hypothetical protein